MGNSDFLLLRLNLFVVFNPFDEERFLANSFITFNHERLVAEDLSHITITYSLRLTLESRSSQSSSYMKYFSIPKAYLLNLDIHLTHVHLLLIIDLEYLIILPNIQ